MLDSGFREKEDSKVISGKKEVFQNIAFNRKMKKVKAEMLVQEKMRLHEHLRQIVLLPSSTKEVAKKVFQALQIALSF